MTLIISLLAIMSANSPAHGEKPLTERSTAKTTDQFSECFVALQHQDSKPSWQLLYGDGARFGNAGAPGVDNPYSVRFIAGQAGNKVQVFLDRRDGSESPLLEAVKRCS